MTRLFSRIYYGWVMLSAVSFTEMISWGVLYYAFTVFVKPLHIALGWSTAEITGAFSLALLCSGAAALPVGSLLDRYGTRWLMTCGSCAAALLTLAWAAVNSLTLFYLIWAAIGVTMSTVLYDPAFALVAVWFRRQRARALTLLTFLAGFASVIFVPLAGWLVQTQGWRLALVSLALTLALGTIPLHALTLRRRPEDMGLLPDGDALSEAMSSVDIAMPDKDTASFSDMSIGDIPAAEAAAGTASSAGIHMSSTDRAIEQSASPQAALKGSAFWWMAAAFSLTMLAAGALTVHLVPYLIDRGYPASAAAGMVGLIGIMALPGRLVFTMLGERVSRRLVTALLFLLQTLSLPVLLLLPGIAGVIGFVVLFGAGFGAITPARAALIADQYGSRHYAKINSLLGLFVTGARAVAPVGAGLCYDLLGSYSPVFWVLAGLSALAAGAILLMG